MSCNGCSFIIYLSVKLVLISGVSSLLAISHFEKKPPSSVLIFRERSILCGQAVAVQNIVVAFTFHRLALINTKNSTQMFHLMR